MTIGGESSVSVIVLQLGLELRDSLLETHRGLKGGSAKLYDVRLKEREGWKTALFMLFWEVT